MDFLKKLDTLMSVNSLNKKTLSESSGIPYTTIVNWYKRGYENMGLSSFKQLCDFFGVSMDCMARNEITQIEYYRPKEKDLENPQKRKLFNLYLQLNSEGRARMIERGEELITLGYNEKGDNNEDVS